MPSHNRVTANPARHDQARAATIGTAERRGANKKAAIPELTDVDCHSYRAGHHIHWMQALNSINKPEYARLTWIGKIVALDDFGIDVERADGTIVRYLNHHMERLTVVSGCVGSNVNVNNHWAILRCGSYTFSISEDRGRPLAGCVTDPPPANPTDEEPEDVVLLGDARRSGCSPRRSPSIPPARTRLRSPASSGSHPRPRLQVGLPTSHADLHPSVRPGCGLWTTSSSAKSPLAPFASFLVGS